MKKLSEIVTPIPLLALVDIVEGEVVDGATSPEAEPEGEKEFVKLHKTEKFPDRNGNKDDVFKATNVKKDTSKAAAAPKPGFPPEVKESKKIKWIDAPDLSPAALYWGKKDDYKTGKKAGRLGTGDYDKDKYKSSKSYKKGYTAGARGAQAQASARSKMDEEQLDEKWGKENVVNPAEKGKYKGRSLASLRKAYHRPGTDKKELAFAIRAKTGWGKVE